jgi:hypothetical protein
MRFKLPKIRMPKRNISLPDRNTGMSDRNTGKPDRHTPRPKKLLILFPKPDFSGLFKRLTAPAKMPANVIRPPRRSFRLEASRRSRRRSEPAPNPYGLKPLSVFETFPLFTLPIVGTVIRWLRLIGWLCLDASRAIQDAIKNQSKIHLYGIWCFVGLPGAGKTMSMVRYLDDMRRRYGDKIIIITNFFYAGQDRHLSGWDVLKERYDKPVIFAWDELQNEFNSRLSAKFPMALVQELTQNRKGHGKQVVYTVQDFAMVDLNFRRLTTHVVECRTWFGRLTVCKHFTTAVYENRHESKSIDVKIKCRPYRKEKFIQSDYLRSRYDSYQRLDYLKDMEYVFPRRSEEA